MTIKVKHSPSAAAIGESAYTIGRGEKRRWDTDIGLKQQSLNIQGMSVALQAEGRAAAIEQRKKESERLHGLREEELGFRKQQWEEEPARQLEMGLQQQKILQSKISWQYDEGQKREMAKVTSGIGWLRDQVSAGKWTAEQAEQAEQQLWRKYHSIIPLPVYDDTATPQERFNQGRVKDETTGAYYMETAPGKFEAMGISFKDYANLRADAIMAFTSKDDEGNLVYDLKEADKFVDETMVRFTKIQGFAARAEEEQKRQAERGPQPSLEQEAQRKAAVEALPVMFDAIIKGQPKIGRKKKRQPSLFADDVYGEEAYNKVLTEAIGRGKQEGIPPDVIKAELDNWWDAQYDKDRGKRFQRFGNRMEFKSTVAEQQVSVLAEELEKSLNLSPEAALRVARGKLTYDAKAAPAERKVAPEVDMNKLDEMALSRIQQYKSMKNIKWSWMSEKFGVEETEVLKYICESGNEQAIANALRKMGII